MPSMKDQLILELKRDKKRAAILGIVAVVGLVMVGRLALKKLAPSSAGAAPTAAAVETGTAPNGTPNWQPGTGAAESGDYMTQIDTTITRDIFTPPERFYPAVATPKKALGVADGTRSLDKENVRKDAAAMTLESTILSSTPKAIINGQLSQVGDTVNGFRVTQIGPRSVTMERDGVSITLEMASDN